VSDGQVGEAGNTACKIWFGGDTAYKGVRRGMTPEEEAKLPHCPAFKEIGDKFKYFDFAVSASSDSS
jgi:N-acyl-phosphatidylethanolamine-hydrolysing phospholipase D